LANLSGKSAQLLELLRAHQELLVVSARARMRSMLAGDIAADFAIVLDRRPDADMDHGKHGPFGNH
jgi:hypothetical protein